MRPILISLTVCCLLFILLSAAGARLLQPPNAVQGWDLLCQQLDCDKFPYDHVTYEIDGQHYYWPAIAIIRGDAEFNLEWGWFNSVLPSGFKRDRTQYAGGFAVSKKCCIGWGLLDFDLYLETAEERRVTRGFARLHADTEQFRHYFKASGLLPRHFGLDTDYPSREMETFRFSLHSSQSHDRVFQLGYHLRRSSRFAQRTYVRASNDIPSDQLESFNDAFWLIDEDNAASFGYVFTPDATAVLSKSPMILGRHVYGRCEQTCTFHTLRFYADPPNDQPLIIMKFGGTDIRALTDPICQDNWGDDECHPDTVNLAQMDKWFTLVEQSVDGLRQWPRGINGRG